MGTLIHEAPGLGNTRCCRHGKHGRDVDVRVYFTSFWWHCADNCNFI